MNKSFRTGIITGILIGIIAATVIGCATYFATDGFTNFSRDEKKLNLIETNKKIRQIEATIDEKFLYEKDKQKIKDHLYKGILYGLGDPYAEYYNKTELEELLKSTQGTYCGIGASIIQDNTNLTATVVDVFKDSPARDAGLQKEDVVKKVDNVDVTAMELSEIISDHILGEKGKKVTLTVYRPSTKKTLSLTMTRRIVEQDTVAAEMLEDKIGYVKITGFDEVTTKQFNQAIKKLQSQGAKRLLFDLRNNPGGNLDTVIEMLATLLPDGKIVYTKDKNGKGDSYYTKDGKIYTDAKDAKQLGYPKKDSGQIDLPMVVLINENSASASEIFTQALKDYKWATIVGTQSFGKGIVQEAIQFNDKTALKLTIASYFTKSGTVIQGKGVTPEVVTRKATALEDREEQLGKAVKVLKEIKPHQ